MPCCASLLLLLREYGLAEFVVERTSAGPATCRSVSAGGDAHGPSRAGDDLGRLLDVVGVEVFHLRLGDLANLVGREMGDLCLVRLARALGHAGSLLDQLGGRRRLRDEGERPVLIDRDLHGDYVATL